MAIANLFLGFMKNKKRNKSPLRVEKSQYVGENPNVKILESKYR